MSALTYERVNSLSPQSQHGSNSVLKDLHDYIYQWTETIPTGGIRVDISQALRTIYEKHAEQLAIEKARAAQTKEIESSNLNLDGNDNTYDAEYDSEDETKWDY